MYIKPQTQPMPKQQPQRLDTVAVTSTEATPPAQPFAVNQPAAGVADVMGLLFNNDAIGSAIPLAGEDDEWREIGDLERNTPPERPGYVHAWIRGWYANGDPDTKNLQRMVASKRNPLGWTPRVPTAEEASSYAIVAWQGHSLIAVNGMILMERTVEVDERARRINRNRIAQQSMGANLDNEGNFDSKYARMFGSVKGTAKTGRDAADYIDS